MRGVLPKVATSLPEDSRDDAIGYFRTVLGSVADASFPSLDVFTFFQLELKCFSAL